MSSMWRAYGAKMGMISDAGTASNLDEERAEIAKTGQRRVDRNTRVAGRSLRVPQVMGRQ